MRVSIKDAIERLESERDVSKEASFNYIDEESKSKVETYNCLLRDVDIYDLAIKALKGYKDDNEVNH